MRAALSDEVLHSACPNRTHRAGAASRQPQKVAVYRPAQCQRLWLMHERQTPSGMGVKLHLGDFRAAAWRRGIARLRFYLRPCNSLPYAGWRKLLAQYGVNRVPS
jgi:hypothetical protein